MDRHGPSSRRPLSLGTTLRLAAIHRAVWPCSKRRWAAWAPRTSLPPLFALRPTALTSQDVWDHMAVVSGPALEALEAAWTRTVLHQCARTLETLCDDTANFFPALARTNPRSALAPRGHSKPKRTDLRPGRRALLAAREGQMPLSSSVDEGNKVDATPLPDSLTAIRPRVEQLVGQVADRTRVDDTGQNSKAHHALGEALPVHAVASLGPTQHADRMAMPTGASTPVGPGPVAHRLVSRCRRSLWGAERTLVLCIRPPRRRGPMRGLHQPRPTRLDALEQGHHTCAKPGRGPRTTASARQRGEAVGVGQDLNHVRQMASHPRRKGANRLSWAIAQVALESLETAGFGTRWLMTDHHDGSTAAMLLASPGQSHVEAACRQRKAVDHVTVRPPDHWTDQQGRVHTLRCLLAYRLCRLMEPECRTMGSLGSLSHVVERLGTVRLALLVRPAGTRGGRPRGTWVLEDSAPEAWRL